MKITSQLVLATSMLFISLQSFSQLLETSDRSQLIEKLDQQQPIVVLSGNTPNSIIPELPNSVLDNSEIAALHAQKNQNNKLIEYYERKYNRIVNTLFKNYNTEKFNFKQEVLKAANNFHIDPMHIVAAIVGEHVFNVDIKDQAQEYFIKAKMWTSYFQGKHPFAEVIDCPEFNVCHKQPSDYFKWSCFESQWSAYMRGKVACGRNTPFESKGFMMNFFNPMVAGKTYGLGQLGPIKVLSLNDLVNRFSQLPILSIKDVNPVYETTLNPATSVHYVAAAAFNSIEIYKKFSGFDISKNIGLTATLYNLGFEYKKALELKNVNDGNRKRGKDLKSPQVNYYGWFINHVENDLRKRFEKL